jgi:MFS transporter, ACS family, D-galactonate transporter
MPQSGAPAVRLDQHDKPTHTRHLMLLMVFLATVINYLDRTNLSVAAPLLTKELQLDEAQTGILFSAFAWTYAICNLPGGYIVDRFGARVTYAWSLFLWSAATGLQTFAGSFLSLFNLRLAVGAAEAPAFPANNRVVTLWFPTRERGIASACFVSGQYIGTGLCTPLLFWIAASWGWRAIFLVTGAFGILISIGWWLVYRDPLKSRRANQAEIREIAAGGAGIGEQKPTPFRWHDVWELLSYRQIWALCIGKFSVSVAIFFLLTWFPSYLMHDRGLSLLKVGGYAMAPYLAAAIGVLVGGTWSDMLLRRGVSQTFARKVPIVTGFLLTSTIFLANFTTSNLSTISVLTCAFFFSGVSSNGWAVTSDVAPLKLVGLTGGIVNFAANLAGIVTPIAVGYIVKNTHSYFWALGLVAVIPAVLGVFAYTVVLGEIRRIELP